MSSRAHGRFRFTFADDVALLPRVGHALPSPLRCRQGVAAGIAGVAFHTRGGRSRIMLEGTDEQLLSAIAKSSEAALETFYDRHAAAVFALARKIVRTGSDAEEVVQDVFLKVWQRANDYDAHRGTVLTWLMTIAHHAAVDVFRRNRLRQTDELDEALAHNTSADRLPSDLSLDRLMAAQALEALEPAERSVLEALYFEGLSQSQLAERSGVPLGTVKSRARNALQRLRAQLEELG